MSVLWLLGMCVAHWCVCQAFTPFTCVNPTTGVTTTCNVCPEDQQYVPGFTVYCPADTCTCAAGSGYNTHVSGHCVFGMGSLKHIQQAANPTNAYWACITPAGDPVGVCSGHGDLLPQDQFNPPYIVGFWVQGTPQSPQITLNNVGQFLNGRCSCDSFTYTSSQIGQRSMLVLSFYIQGSSGINCHDLPPCPSQNGGTACGGSPFGVCQTTISVPASCVCNFDSSTGLVLPIPSDTSIYPWWGDTASPAEHCCPRFGVPGDFAITSSSPVCGNRGICASTGACSCFSGFAGAYCCPTSSTTPTVPCSGRGTCGLDGSCSCSDGYTGSGCQVNTRCPTDDPNLECSGGGVCKQFSQIEVAIARGNFAPPTTFDCKLVDNNAQFICDGWRIPGTTTLVSDYGMISYILRLYQFALFNDVSQNTTVSFWNTLIHACASAGSQTTNRPQCFRNINLAVIARGDLARTLSQTRYRSGHTAVWVSDALSSLFPHLSFFDSTISSLIVTGVSSPTAALQATALAILMGYDTFIDWLDPFLRASVPDIGSYYCECNIQAWNPSFFANAGPILPGSNSCSGACQSSHAQRLGQAYQTGQHAFSAYAACTGWVDGVFHGICRDNDNSCVCSAYFGGPLCDTSVAGVCFNTSIHDAYPCTTQNNGVCVTTVLDVASFTLACQCKAAWTGKYCQYSTCALPGSTDTQRQIECSNRGVCGNSGKCVCDVDGQLALSTSRSTRPVLPTGQDCSHNGIAACGSFLPGTLNQNVGQWISCSGSGTCVYNTTIGNSTCVCETGAFGNQCQFDTCDPDCPDNAICDITVGECNCLFAYTGADCSVNRCVNGLPSDDGSFCQCDAHWTTDSGGLCTVVQCPLVVYTPSGPRPCRTTDPICTPSQDFTLVPCCYDACEAGRCLLNRTDNTVACLCDPPEAYTQDSGICFPICNGQPYFITNGHLTCDCSHVAFSRSAGQFVDAFCEVFSCLNGGTALTGGCSCPSGFSDQVCGTPDCSPFGVLDDQGGFCDCTAPADNGAGSVLCLANTCGPTGASVVQNSSGSLQCQCPTGFTTSNDGQTCNALPARTSSSSTAGRSTASSSSTGSARTSSSSSSTGRSSTASNSHSSPSSSSTGPGSTGNHVAGSSSSTGHKIISSSSTARNLNTLSSSSTAGTTATALTGATGATGTAGATPLGPQGSPSFTTEVAYITTLAVVGGVAVVLAAVMVGIAADDLIVFRRGNPQFFLPFETLPEQPIATVLPQTVSMPTTAATPTTTMAIQPQPQQPSLSADVGTLKQL